MKVLYVILFSLLIIHVTSKDLFVYIDFYWNQDYIANSLCEDRDIPVSKCNGKCQLKKSIAKKSEEKKKQHIPINEKRINLDLADAIQIAIIVNTQLEVFQELPEFYPYNYSFSYLDEIFHPPQLS